MQISNRVSVAITLAVTVACACIIIDFVVLSKVTGQQHERAESLLRAELGNYRDRVNDYLGEVSGDLSIITSSGIVQEGIVQMDNAAKAIGADPVAILQQLYISDNPNPEGRKHKLLRATDNSTYSELHQRYHKWFSELTAAQDYHDLFLVTSEGSIVYTVYKEDDFATNLLTGPYRESALAETFRRVHADPRAGRIVFSDFTNYASGGGKPTAFAGTPVVQDGKFIGAMLIQLRSEHFDGLMSDAPSLGESGQTFLVGPDMLMRSRSRFASESTVLEQRVDTPSVKFALEGKAGVRSEVNYRDQLVMSAYAPLEWAGVTWAVLAEIEYSEVHAPMRALRLELAMLGVLLVLAAFAIGWILGEKES